MQGKWRGRGCLKWTNLEKNTYFSLVCKLNLINIHCIVSAIIYIIINSSKY